MKGRLTGFGLVSAVCLALYWPGLMVWFAMDDFAWLGLRAAVHTWGDVLALFVSPMAQGTIRPLSERLYFVVLEGLFGLEALPFRVVAFAVQILNLWLAARLVERMTGSRLAGAAAALLWIVNSALALAMSWTSAFNQILWPCFLLASCHARWSWLTTGSGRARIAEWAFFLLGFGALELQVVYPAIAGAMTVLYRRERWREPIPLFAVAGAYAVFNRSIANKATTAVYQLYWDESIVATLGTYLRMVTGFWRPELPRDPEAWWLAGEVATALVLAAALLWQLWRRERAVAFGLVWFFAALAPILPLKNHISDYYLTVPCLGLAMAAGVCAAKRPVWALAPVLLYCAGSGYWARRVVDYNFERAEQGRVLFAGVVEASRLHPGKTILLTAVSSDQYWSVLNDSPFRLVNGLQVYLAPEGDANIEKHPDLGDPGRMVMAGPAAWAALEAGKAVIYSPAGGKLRNVTDAWRRLGREKWSGTLTTALEMGQPLPAGQLGEGWYQAEPGFRWASGRATVRLGAPGTAKEIVVEAFRGAEGGRRGVVRLEVRVSGVAAGRWELLKDDSPLRAVAALPEGVDRTKPVAVDLIVSPVLNEAGAGGRSLGLAVTRITMR